MLPLDLPVQHRRILLGVLGGKIAGAARPAGSPGRKQLFVERPGGYLRSYLASLPFAATGLPKGERRI